MVTLAAHHLQQLKDGSGIPEALITQRGYCTLDASDDLKTHGFNTAQSRLVPALGIPVWGLDGTSPLWQIRPDTPRVLKGREVKYETPAGERLRLDIHPSVRPLLANPTIPLWVVEGIKKGDALAAQRVCCIALMGGVYGWRGRNHHGGKVVLPEWQDVPLNGRAVIIAYDSDITHKPQVARAAKDFTTYLAGRGAHPAVLQWPTDMQTTKVGVDDYLLTHRLEELQALVVMGPTPADSTGADERESQTDTLLRLAKEAQLLRTDDGMRYARVPVNQHTEVLSLQERGGFREWLVHQYRRDMQRLPSTTALSQVVEALSAEARFEGARTEVFTRLAFVDQTLYLDLCNAAHEVVAIDAHGWRLTTTAPVHFRRPAGMLPLPRPDPSGTVNDLYALLPVGKETSEATLLVGWAVGTLMPDGPAAFLGIHGEQGTGKTFVTRLLRALTDSNQALTRSAPKEEKDLILAARNGAVVGLENLSVLPDWLSDALCCLSTKAGLGTRKLYTDDEEIIFAVRRPVVWNGIAEVATRGDLLDRTLQVTLPTITEGDRKHERHLLTLFADLHAKALGVLVQAASCALRRRDTLQLPHLPRLADFACWVEAAAPVLGWQPGAFLSVMQQNRKDNTGIELEASLLYAPLLNYMARQPSEEVEQIPLKDLLATLTKEVTEDDSKPPPKGWPRLPRQLSATLKRLAPALRSRGWTVVFHPRAAHGFAVSLTVPPELPDEDEPPRTPEDDPPQGLDVDDDVDNVDGLKVSTLFNSLNNNGYVDSVDNVDDSPKELNQREMFGALEERKVRNTAKLNRKEAVLSTLSTSSTETPIFNTLGCVDSEISSTLPPFPSTQDPAHAPSCVGPTQDLPHITYVRQPAQLAAVLPELMAAPCLGLDTETTGLNWHRDKVRLVQLAPAPDRVIVVDAFQCPLQVLAPVFARAMPFIGQNLKFDALFLHAAGLPVPPQMVDTMLVGQLLGACASERVSSDLEALAKHYLGIVLDKTLQQGPWDGVLSEAHIQYAARDAVVLLPLVDALQDAIHGADMDRIARMEQACLPAMVWVEQAGMPLDTGPWLAIAEEAQREKDALEQVLQGLVDASGYSKPVPLTKKGAIRKGFDPSINWHSRDQVLAVLSHLGFVASSVAKDTLKMLKTDHPLVRAYLERVPWVEGIKRGLPWIAEFYREGRIYANWQQLGSTAGRMSCKEPNLQNIPRSKAYRSCFVAPDGRAILKADYAQIELRIAAVIAGETRMLEAIGRGEDLHRTTAARVRGTLPGDVTPEERQVAKMVNFGLIYGLGAASLQKKVYDEAGITISMEQADDFRQTFFDLYPAFRQWHTGLRRQLQQHGSIETRTLTGRRRLGIQSYTDGANTPVQGSAADGFKVALARLYQERNSYPEAQVIGVVHDEILVECPAAAAPAVQAWVKQHMEAAMSDVVQGRVPIEVEVHSGKDWAGTPL